MNAPIDIQTIHRRDGSIEYVVMPYEEYLRILGKAETLVPHEVVGLAIDNDWTPVRAWREYFELTQADIAARLGITQPAYAQQESSVKLRKSTREKIAVALGIRAEQLDF